MNIDVKFSFEKNESNVAQSINVTLIIDGCDLGLGVSKQRDKDINELITSLRTGEISNWSRDEERIKNVLLERLKFLTMITQISQDIKSFIENDTSRWKYLLEEAYKMGIGRKKQVKQLIGKLCCMHHLKLKNASSAMELKARWHS